MRTLDGLLGIRLRALGPEHAEASFEVADRHRQRFGRVHGGTYAAVAEFLASEGTVHGVAAEDHIAVGSSNQTSFLRPVTEGTIRAVGRPRHRGRRTWVWDVDFHDAAGRLCATSRVTLAVLPAPPGAPGPIEAPCVIGEA